MIACMGGWCRVRDICRHYVSDGDVIVERLCEPGLRDAYAPLPRAGGVGDASARSIGGPAVAAGQTRPSTGD